MDAATIAAQTNTQVQTRNATTRGFDSVSSEDFFGLMIEELRSQDPLNPKDNQQLLQQMSNIRQMEQSATLTKTLESLANEQRFGTTSGLIGNYVLGTVRDSAGVPTDIDGLVIGVSFEGNGNAILNLHNGQRLPAKDVREVTLVENLPPDILDQLEAELAATAGGDAPPADETTPDGGVPPVDGETGGDNTTPNGEEPPSAAARAIPPFESFKQQPPDRAAALKLLNRIRAQREAVHPDPVGRALRDGADLVGQLLDGLFSPGIGVRAGA